MSHTKHTHTYCVFMSVCCVCMCVCVSVSLSLYFPHHRADLTSVVRGKKNVMNFSFVPQMRFSWPKAAWSAFGCQSAVSFMSLRYQSFKTLRVTFQSASPKIWQLCSICGLHWNFFSCLKKIDNKGHPSVKDKYTNNLIKSLLLSAGKNNFCQAS